jgi:hypothetical protein
MIKTVHSQEKVYLTLWSVCLLLIFEKLLLSCLDLEIFSVRNHARGNEGVSFLIL